MDAKLRLVLALVLAIREARFARGISCVRCHSTSVILWGLTAAGRQRYMCRGCNHTFSDLTGTPAAFIKRLDLWARYTEYMRDGLSLRAIARLLGIHVSTSFRWRHRLAAPLRTFDVDTLRGWVELEMLWFAYSRKGERGLTNARRRGVPDRLFTDARPVRVILANDRTGNATHAMFMAPLSSATFEKELVNRFVSCAGLVAGLGLMPVLRPIARKRAIPLVDARPGQLMPPRELAWSQLPARKQAALLLDWLERFRGVATKYLPNYLAWHCSLDRARRQRFESVLLRWPISADGT